MSEDDKFDGEDSALLTAGDREACGRVYVRMRRPILAYINYRLGGEARHKQVAEDIFQNIFVNILESFCKGKSHYEGRGSLLNYLLKIARNNVINFLIKDSHNREVPIDTDREDDSSNCSTQEPSDPGPGPAKEYEEKEFEEIIESMIRALPPTDRDVLSLKFLEGRQNWEIAEILGITRNNVRGRASRARKKLQKLLRSKDRVEAVKEWQWRGISVIEESGRYVVKRVWGVVALMVSSPRAGDIIEKMGDKPVTKGNPFAQVTKEFAASEDVILTVIRVKERNRRVEITVPGTQNGGGRPFS